MRFGLQLCLGAIVAIELASFSRGILRATPISEIRNGNPILELVASEIGLERIVAQQSLLSDREAWSAGVQKIQAYEPVPLISSVSAVDVMTNVAEVPKFALGFHPITLDDLDKTGADLLGVKYVAVETAHGESQISLPGWRTIATGVVDKEFSLRRTERPRRSFAIYENETPLPRAFVVGDVRLLRPDESLVDVVESIDPRKFVVLRDDVLPPGSREQFHAAEIVRYTPNQVVVETTLDEPGYLILSDTLHPGWTATDNGRPVPIQSAYVSLRAVALSAGEHRVVFQYTPLGFRVGLLVSLVTLGALTYGTRRSFYYQRLARSLEQD